MTTIHITRWQRGFLAISFVKLLRSVTGEGLASAKEKLDRLLAGEEITIELPDASIATTLLHDLETIGAVAFISSGPP